MKPRLLLLTNEASPGDAVGQVHGYQLLAERGHLRSVKAVSWHPRYHGSEESAEDAVALALQEPDYDIALIWSPGRFPRKVERFDQMMAALNGRTLGYWEGDAWGRRKPLFEAAGWWATHADLVFTVTGRPQTDLLMAAGAARVALCLQTYCHIQFQSAEIEPPPHMAEMKVAMVSSNTARIPGLTGLPGSLGRQYVARRLRRSLGTGFLLHGRGWPSRWQVTPIGYSEQIAALRRASVTANWDHFPHYADSGSDRLPISLLAGRPHVTTAHPGMAWAPTEDQGLFQEASPQHVVETTLALLKSDPERLRRAGNEAHRWAKNRVSHREAAQHIMSLITDAVPPVPLEPWTAMRRIEEATRGSGIR